VSPSLSLGLLQMYQPFMTGLKNPMSTNMGPLVVILKVRSFHNAVVLFLESLERLQCSGEGWVALRPLWCGRHKFTLLFAGILLFYLLEIYFAIDLKNTFLSDA
jgi:hypothetical protein